MSCSSSASAAVTKQSYDVRAGLERLPGFVVVGVSAVVSNDGGQASDAINALWERFFEEQVGQKIEGRADDVIYAVYSDYEGDHTKPYRLTIGYKADDVESVGEGLARVQVVDGDYALMAAQGPQPESLIGVWEAIWASDLDRAYGTDYEVYGPRFFEDGVHEVLVCLGVKL